MSGLPPLDTLANPHFLLTGAKTGEALAHLLDDYRRQADFVVMSQSSSELAQRVGRAWDDASKLNLNPRVLGMLDGAGIVRDLIRAECGQSGRLQGCDPEPILIALERAEAEVHESQRGRGVSNAVRIMLQAIPEDLASANEYLAGLDLPPIHVDEDIAYVHVRSADEGQGLLPFGVEPFVTDEARRQDLVRRLNTLRQQFPKASEEAVREEALEQQRSAMWVMAVEAPDEDAGDADVARIPVLHAFEQTSEFRRVRDVLASEWSGETRSAAFEAGGVHCLDVSKCSQWRRGLLLLDVMLQAEALREHQRWRCLVIDDTVLKDVKRGMHELEFIVRQGRKVGLSVVLVESQGRSVPKAVRDELGNVIAAGATAEEIGFPQPANAERGRGLAEVLGQLLRSRWLYPAKVDDESELRATHRLPGVGEVIVADRTLLWKEPDSQRWRQSDRFDAAGRIKAGGEVVDTVERGIALVHALHEFVATGETTQWWWYPVAMSRSVPLSGWKETKVI